MDQQNNTNVAITVIIFLVVSLMVAGLLVMFTGSLGGQVYQTAESDINEIGVTYVTNQSFVARDSTLATNQSFLTVNGTWVSLGHYPVINTTGYKWHVYNMTGVDKTSWFVMNHTTGKIKHDASHNAAIGGRTCTITYRYGSDVAWVDLGNYPVINSTGNKWHVYNATGVDKTTWFTMNLSTGKILLGSSHYTTLGGVTCTATYQYGNETIRNYIKSGIIETFHSQAVMAGYIPLIGLAIIIVIIIFLVIGSMVGFVGGFRGSSGSLF